MKQLLTFALTLTLANAAILPAVAQPSSPPPRTSPPRGNPVPGGTFSDSSECKKTPLPLNALIPRKNLEPFLIGQGAAASQYPTFWIYIPYASGEAIAAQFSLHNRQGRSLYRTAINLPKTAGIIGIQIPAEAKYVLEEEQFYRWYFSIQCQPASSFTPELVVDGWVKKVASTPESEAQINVTQPDIWYDSLTRLANLRLASPQDEQLKTDWSNLLTSAGLEALVEEPLLGPVVRND